MDPILACLAQIWIQKFFSWVLPLLDIIHCCKLSLYAISRKTIEPNFRKWPKTSFAPNFGPFWPKFGLQNIFSWILPDLDVKNCFKLSLHVISRKTNEQHLRKSQKNLVLGPILAPLAHIWSLNLFFLQILPLLHDRNCFKFILYAISRRTNEPNLRKWQKT